MITPDASPPRTWADVGLYPPPGATGDIRLPCPHCAAARGRERDTCLSVHLERGIWYCHYCGWKGSLRRPGSMPILSPPGPRQRSPDDIHRRQLALERVWREARAVTKADPAARYLSRRGLWDGQESVPDVLRCHLRLPYYHGDNRYTYHPALIASVQDPRGDVVSVHRTYLTNGGEKANVPDPKKTMQTPTTVTGAAVRLDAPLDTLAVTEGIETGLAVRLSAGVPAWAALSAGNMAAIILPKTVRLVLICADHDAGGTGEHAAKALARRLLAEGRRVKIFLPSTAGTDWADGLQGGPHA